MSVAASTAIALGVAAGTAGAGIYGAHKAGEANEMATKTQAASAQAAIDEQKRQDAQQQAQFNAQQAAAKAQWDAEQQIRAPYRQAGATALMKLGSLLGQNFNPQAAAMTQARPYAPPAPNQPGAPPTFGGGQFGVAGPGTPTGAQNVKMRSLVPQSFIAPPPPAPGALQFPVRYPVQT